MHQAVGRHNSASSARSSCGTSHAFRSWQGFNRPAVDDHGHHDVMPYNHGSVSKDNKRVAPVGDLSLPGSRGRRKQKMSHRSRRSDRVPTSEGSNISRPGSRLPKSDAAGLPHGQRFSQRIADALNEWQRQTSDLSGEVKALNDLLRQKEQRLTWLREQHKIGRQALEEAATKYAKLSKANHTLGEQNNHLRVEQQQLNEQLTESNGRVTCLTSEFQQVSLDLEKARTELRKHYHFKSHFNRLLGEFRSFGSETRAKWRELLDRDLHKRRTSEDEFDVRAAIEKAELVRDGLKKVLEENRSMVDQQEKTGKSRPTPSTRVLLLTRSPQRCNRGESAGSEATGSRKAIATTNNSASRFEAMHRILSGSVGSFERNQIKYGAHYRHRGPRGSKADSGWHRDRREVKRPYRPCNFRTDATQIRGDYSEGSIFCCNMSS